MIIEFEQSIANGKIRPPISKSELHRALIGASLSRGVSLLKDVKKEDLSDDVFISMNCLKKLGGKIDLTNEGVIVEGFGNREKVNSDVINMYCKDSASTLRFLIPICLALGLAVDFEVAPSLAKRPMEEYIKLSKEKGFYFDKDRTLFRLRGSIEAGEYRISNAISSQYTTGLLFALSLFKRDSQIILEGPINSSSYIDMTINMLKEMGIKIKQEKNILKVEGGQTYKSGEYELGRDFSSASYLDSFNLFDSNVEILGMRGKSYQADAIYPYLFKELLGLNANIDISQCPDLGPLLFALAGALNGASFTGWKRLRYKESDRIECMRKNLNEFNIDVIIVGDKLKILRNKDFKALKKPRKILNGFGDHRIVMATSVLLSLTGGSIEGCESVSKSYPRFFKDLEKLGIKFTCR